MNGITLFRDVSVKRKLMFIIFMSTGAALLFATLVLAGQEWITARSEMAFNIGKYAEIISKNCTPALLLDDKKAATKTLDALSTLNEIESAVIYDKDGHPFASYTPSGLATPPPANRMPAGDQRFFSNRRLDLFHPILSGGRQIGTLHMHATLAPLYSKIFLNMGILLAAMLGGLSLAWILAARLHTIITQPISVLIGLMARVSGENDHTLSAVAEGKDELGLLTEKFNEILAQIQARDDALAQQQELVAQRTAELRQSEKKFRSISASAKDAIVMIDNKGNIYYWNTGAEAIFGYSDKEALGKDLHQLLAPKRFHEAIRKGFSHFQNTGEGPLIGKTLELVALRKGGIEFPVEISLSAVKIGDQWSGIGIVRDITERKLVEEQIHTQQELTTQITETIPMRVFWKDRNSRYMGCNTAFARDAGKNCPDDLIGKDDFQLTWREQAEIFRAQDRQVIDTNTPNLFYNERQTINPGKRVWLRKSKVPLHNETGEVIGVLGIYEDITEPMKAQKELEWKNSVLFAQQETSPDAILLVNDKANIVSYNRRFIDLWHISNKLMGVDEDKRVLEAVVEQVVDPEKFLFRVKDLYKHKLEKSHEELLLKDGRIIDRHSSAVIGTDGKYYGRVWYFRDITERKQAEEQIRKQQELTTQIIETIPMRVFWKDRSLRYLGCNTEFARGAGESSPDSLIGKDDFQLVWKEQAEMYRTDDRQVIDTNIPKLSYDEPQTTPTGERMWLRTSKVPLHDEAGGVIGVLGTYEDITGRKKMEIALQESEERFRMAFQNSAVGMALIKMDGQWLQVNDALCRLLGYAKQELLHKTFQDITHPDDLESDLDIAEQLLAGKIEHYHMEKRYFHKEGHIVWVLLSVSLLRDTQGNPIHFICQIEDITEDKQMKEKIRKLNADLEIKIQERTRQLLDAQEELVRKEKLAMLGQVAGSVGHELRNPLGVMSNAVYFLQTVLSDADETTNEYLGIIKGEIEASERIVSDLLDSVRIKPPHPETVEVMQLIEQTLGKCIIPSSIGVKLDIPITIPPLRVDAMQLHQVFRNLISNGVEAMPEGGTLEIRALKDEATNNVSISICDTGIGMTPEQQAKLFQPLFTTKARGIGLGLVVVKNLTEANGGWVEVRSEPGKGTTFSAIFHYEMKNSPPIAETT